jgi:AcrR family transcriptional regulator
MNRHTLRIGTPEPPETPARPSYHHGDLRSALLDAAVEVIAERGLPGLSLRECARRAGVSHAAPYRHFADKSALLSAIARQGFTRLTEVAKSAMEGVEDARERLDTYGVAYVRFAVEHPVHHRVMFSAELEPVEPGPDEGDAFGLLVECAAAVIGDGVDPTIAAVAAWSLTHGLSMLILDGRIPAEYIETPKAVEALARGVIDQWRGPLAARA